MANKLPLEITFIFAVCIIWEGTEDLFLYTFYYTFSIGVKLTAMLKI